MMDLTWREGPGWAWISDCGNLT